MGVAAYHLLLPAALIHGAAARVVGRFYLGVDLFFVLSGFVMALNYGALFAGPVRAAVFGSFLWRRVARIYPLYGAILVARLVYTAVAYGRFDLPRPWIAAPVAHPWVGIPANLMLVQSWGIAASSIGPAWSISTEWAAYWMFPLLAVLMLNRGRGLALAGAAAAACLLVMVAAMLPASAAHGMVLDAWDGRTLAPLMRCLGGFVLGMGVWRVSTWQPARRIARSPWAWAAALGGLAAGVVFDVPDLAMYPVLTAFVLCLACARSGPAMALGLGPVVWLGEISYSVYLLHIFLLHPLDELRASMRLVFPRSVADGLTCVGIFGFLLAASDATYRLIERPGRAWLARPILAPGRSERIRTSGPCVPNTVLYQAELHSDRGAAYSGRAGSSQGVRGCRKDAGRS